MHASTTILMSMAGSAGGKTIEGQAMIDQHEFLTVHGCRIAIRRQGLGPSLLALHGMDGASGFGPLTERLGARFSVVVPSHPGYDASDTPEWLDGISDLANFYLEMIDRLELRNLHLVGTSVGGWIAAEIAVRNSTRLASLTLVAAAGVRASGVTMGDPFLWSPEAQIRNLVYDQAIASAQLQSLVPEDELDRRLKNRFTSAKLVWNPRFYSPELQKWLSRVRIPTAIIWGANDKLFPVEQAHEFKRLIPHSTLSIVPQCGHLVHVEKPEELSALIFNFIRQVA